jgi:hypothetical protein
MTISDGGRRYSGGVEAVLEQKSYKIMFDLVYLEMKESSALV